MGLTKEQMSEVINKLIDQDQKFHCYEDIWIKNKVKECLINNPFILYMLNNDELYKQDDPMAYFNVNILPYYLLPEVQSDVKNYICYETSWTEQPRYNDVMKYQLLTFYIACSCKDGNVIDEDSGIARHDILAALIIDMFNWTNILGFQMKLVSDQSRPVDNGFCARTLVFQQVTPQNITKPNVKINGKNEVSITASLINKYGSEKYGLLNTEVVEDKENEENEEVIEAGE